MPTFFHVVIGGEAEKHDDHRIQCRQECYPNVCLVSPSPVREPIQGGLSAFAIGLQKGWRYRCLGGLGWQMIKGKAVAIAMLEYERKVQLGRVLWIPTCYFRSQVHSVRTNDVHLGIGFVRIARYIGRIVHDYI